MKLNYKRTILVGMAFFLITAFWQAYDAIVPLILTNHFGLPQSASGTIMSLDNILAVFMLPLFGAISDKINTRYGKRTPFIVIGTVAAALFFVVLAFVDNLQITAILNAGIHEIGSGGIPENIWLKILEEETLKVTLDNPIPLICFIVVLFFVLMSMATFRSPAVALMPDVTIKPLRSKGNAIINLTGTAGGIIVLVLGFVFNTSGYAYREHKFTLYVITVVALMLTALIIFMLTVKENQWTQEMAEQTKKFENEDGEKENEPINSKLSRPEFKSLMFILASVALWYIGYNSITSKYSVYATNILKFDFNLTLIVAQAAAIVSYIPVGIISSKFGRKKTILAGVIMLAAAFFIGIFITSSSPEFIMFPVFALAGIGWATINVNSFPMVVELAKGGDIGKYTGYYYTASMAAQIVAPILSGILYDLLGMEYTFFAFGTLFVIFSFITMLFVKHGDSKILDQKSALEMLDVD